MRQRRGFINAERFAHTLIVHLGRRGTIPYVRFTLRLPLQVQFPRQRIKRFQKS